MTYTCVHFEICSCVTVCDKGHGLWEAGAARMEQSAHSAVHCQVLRFCSLERFFCIVV